MTGDKNSCLQNLTAKRLLPRCFELRKYCGWLRPWSRISCLTYFMGFFSTAEEFPEGS